MTHPTRLKSTTSIVLLAVACLIPIVGFPQASSAPVIDEAAALKEQGRLNLVVGNFKKKRGILMVLIYNDSEKWLGEDTVIEKQLPVQESMTAEGQEGEGVIQVSLQLPAGEYAVSVYHDLNSNGKLDSNFFGIPKEPAVVSNNAPARFGPPKYKDAKFLLTADGVEQFLGFK